MKQFTAVLVMSIVVLTAVLGGGLFHRQSAERHSDEGDADLEEYIREFRGKTPVSDSLFSPPVYREGGRRSSLDAVGPNRRVHPAAVTRAQAEMAMISDPLRPDTALVAYIDAGPNWNWSSVECYRTYDRGETWARAFGTYPSINDACDPAVAIDLSGTMYLVYLRYLDVNEVTVVSSGDHGVTWGTPVVVGSENSSDKPFMACDISPESPYANSVYVVYNAGPYLVLSYSRGPGLPFSTPTQIPGSQASVPFPCPAVGPHGELYVAWQNMAWADHQVFVSTSFDGGLRWGQPVLVATLDSRTVPSCETRVLTQWTYPVIGCDISDGPRRGWVYVSWPNIVGETNFECDIVIAHSSDSARTWSDPVRVNDDSLGSLQSQHWMSVSTQDGDIGISWMDSRDAPNHCVYNIYASISEDGGLTWAPNFSVTDTGSIPTASTGFVGHYNGGAAHNDGFYATWFDVRGDAAGDCYAAFYNSMRPPRRVTLYRFGNQVRLRWRTANAPLYKIYKSVIPEGPFDTFVGSTTDTVYSLGPAGPLTAMSFYQVVSATE